MYIVSVYDETNLKLREMNAYKTKDVDFIKHEYSVLFPGKEVRSELYVPRTKEVAEAEIKEKLEKQKKES